MSDRREFANAIRALSMDAVQAANSGHPGMPMGMADIAEVLWNDFLSHNPGNPLWPNRDRFVVSNGHGSMLLYSLLYLSGYDVSIEELKNFRQLGFRTAGHPEYEPEMGVETTTGPLGQGLTNAVGMALAERVLAAHYNRPGHEIIDHHTYVFVGDGCLMEGISHEACSLAGTLGLGKLIFIYDDNGISIDGDVEGWFTDDTPGRFEAYGWHVVRDVDGHDVEAVGKAIEAAREEAQRPTIICCKTVIGWGSPNKQGSESTHGAALGEEEVQATRDNIGWPYPPFEIPDAIRAGWDAKERGRQREDAWHIQMESYASEYPELARELQRRLRGDLPDNWQAMADAAIGQIAENGGDMATRKASQVALEAFGPGLPELIGGSADLTGSNNTFWSGSRTITGKEPDGNYLHFGVREFGMTAILNGISLHGGFKPYGGTFLVFSDYARNAVRMAALMHQPVILVYTHDSIGLGEDGPTHQPVEHLSSLRIIPNMHVWRPCDSVESAVAWRLALESRKTPHSLVFSRQSLPFQTRDDRQIADITRGGYVLRDAGPDPQVILIATGSEVALAMAAARALEEDDLQVRVVSMPCASVFDQQDSAYRDSVLLPDVRKRVAIEAGVPDFWYRYVGDGGAVIGMDTFGASAPAKHLFEHFGFSVENVKKTVMQLG
ncbi:MAG: transketolase [Gammaproteobacteria bacterium SG8_31]|nr:MAG: transketolase [Gammaproteobacteria bacterium SG8_31]